MGLTINDNRLLWSNVLKVCQTKTSGLKNIYESYFKKTFLNSVQDDTLIVGVENASTCTVIKNSFSDIFSAAVYEVTGSNFKLVFVPLNELTQKSNKNDYLKDIPTYFSSTNILQKQFTFSNFVEGPSNKHAKTAAMYICGSLGNKYNPLYIQGHSGLGKTHLLHAIGNQIKQNSPEKRILYVTSQDFVNEYVNFTKNITSSVSLEEYIRTFDVLLIDDIQQLRNKEKTLDYFFNIYNYFIANNKQIVITSDCLQNELIGIPERLITRFLCGLTASITAPDFQTCKEIFLKKCEFNSINIQNISDEVIDYIVTNNSSSIRSLEGIILQILFKTTTNPDIVLTFDELKDILHIENFSIDNNKKTDANKIINVISTYYSIPTDQLTGNTRKAQVTLARQIAIYLLRDVLDMTYKEIGKIFSNRDHATIIHSINKIEKLLKTNTNVQNVINSIKQKIT